MTVASHWLAIAGVLVIWRRSRRREGRSLLDPYFTRADAVTHFKAMAFLDIVRVSQRYLPALPLEHGDGQR